MEDTPPPIEEPYDPVIPPDVEEAISFLTITLNAAQADAGAEPITDHNRRRDDILRDYINGLNARLVALLAPLELDYVHGRPTMLIKLGSEARGWIPRPQHFDKVTRFVKAAGLDQTKNVLVFHFGINIEERP